MEEYEDDRYINNAEDILDGNYTTDNYWVIITENYSKTEDSQTTSSESTATGTPTTTEGATRMVDTVHHSYLHITSFGHSLYSYRVYRRNDNIISNSVKHNTKTK